MQRLLGQPAEVVCCSFCVCLVVRIFLDSGCGHRCQHPRTPAPDRAARSCRGSAQRGPRQSPVGGQQARTAATERARCSSSGAIRQVALRGLLAASGHRRPGRCHRSWRSGPSAMGQGWPRCAGRTARAGLGTHASGIGAGSGPRRSLRSEDRQPAVLPASVPGPGSRDRGNCLPRTRRAGRQPEADVLAARAWCLGREGRNRSPGCRGFGDQGRAAGCSLGARAWNRACRCGCLSAKHSRISFGPSGSRWRHSCG